MKKILFILSMIAVMVCTAGCENEYVMRLKREIEAENKKCPINMGMAGDMLSLKYDGKAKEVQLYFSLNEDILSIEALKKNKEMAIRAMKLSFAKGESRQLLEEMINAGAGLSVTFKASSTGKSLTVKLPLKDLKEIRDTPMTEEEINKMLYDNMLAAVNSQCPYYVDEGIEAVKVYDDGRNMVYSYRMDEELYDIATLRCNQDAFKEEMKSMFTDPLLEKELAILKSLDKGFAYHYYGDTSGESVDIVFSNDELNDYLK